MMMKLLLLSALVAVSTASPVNVKIGLQLPRELLENKDSGNANRYVDLVLRILNQMMPEELPLPDIGTMFHLHDCFMFGLDNGLHRSGDATMVTVGETVKFSASFAMKDLGVTCSWKYLTHLNLPFTFLTSHSSPCALPRRVPYLAVCPTSPCALPRCVPYLAVCPTSPCALPHHRLLRRCVNSPACSAAPLHALPLPCMHCSSPACTAAPLHALQLPCMHCSSPACTAAPLHALQLPKKRSFGE
ncbi:hypothetical protein FHG87_002994 [Trinorchestia longiramus]|nr:hypothetical protein FHG87_002994 [Trinorchestia longiramus]